MRTLAAAVVAILALQPLAQASACTWAPARALFSLDQGWQSQFGEWFEEAGGVYLVTVADDGTIEGYPLPMPCDRYPYPPPPITLARGKAQKAEFTELWRRYEADLVACSASKASVHVIETLKGEPRKDWVERFSAIQVIDDPPPEPLVQDEGGLAYGALVVGVSYFSCGPAPFARRMSARASYLAFTSDGGEHPGRITQAFLVDDRSPFLAQARRLARPAP